MMPLPEFRSTGVPKEAEGKLDLPITVTFNNENIKLMFDTTLDLKLINKK